MEQRKRIEIFFIVKTHSGDETDVFLYIRQLWNLIKTRPLEEI